MSTSVVVAAFRSSSEAAMAKSLLVAEGIEARAFERRDDLERLCADVFDDGFDVVVETADADRAIAFLRRIFPDDPIDAELVERCPSCGATEIFRLPRLRIFLVVATLLIAIGAFVDQRDLFLLAVGIVGGALLLAPNRRCRSCGEPWRG